MSEECQPEVALGEKGYTYEGRAPLGGLENLHHRRALPRPYAGSSCEEPWSVSTSTPHGYLLPPDRVGRSGVRESPLMT